MLKERSFDKIVVERRLGLAGIDRGKGRVRRLVLKVEDEGLSELAL
jgi:hypothetical protein